ncbi:hypothetical protein JW766_02595 [Candidatus Dojkabacteria bacterium]|nr:hypothetical protein [Candidatus Dojkabacteria bacterium]
MAVYLEAYNMIEHAERLQFEGAKIIGKFEKARESVAQAVALMPADLQPPINVKDPHAVFLCSPEGFYEFHLLYLQQVFGDSYGVARERARELAAIRTGVCIHQTGQIALLHLGKLLGDNPFMIGLHEKHRYILVLGHELGHLGVPFVPQISHDEAAVVLGRPWNESVRMLQGLSTRPIEVIRVDQYGRSLDVWYRVEGEEKIMIQPLDTIASEVLNELFSDVYMQYIDFVRFCAFHGIQLQTIAQDWKAYRNSLIRYSRSREYKSLINPDDLNVPTILIAAFEFGGYENLLRTLRAGLTSPLRRSKIELNEREGMALAYLCLVSIAQSYLDKLIKSYSRSGGEFRHIQSLEQEHAYVRFLKEHYAQRDFMPEEDCDDEELQLPEGDLVLQVAGMAFSDPRWQSPLSILDEVEGAIQVARGMKAHGVMLKDE